MLPSGIHEGWNLMGARVHHNSGAIILPFFGFQGALRPKLTRKTVTLKVC